MKQSLWKERLNIKKLTHFLYSNKSSLRLNDDVVDITFVWAGLNKTYLKHFSSSLNVLLLKLVIWIYNSKFCIYENVINKSTSIYA